MSEELRHRRHELARWSAFVAMVVLLVVTVTVGLPQAAFQLAAVFAALAIIIVL